MRDSIWYAVQSDNVIMRMSLLQFQILGPLVGSRTRFVQDFQLISSKETILELFIQQIHRYCRRSLFLFQLP